MSLKKRALIVSPGIPYPPIDGHKLKIYNLLKLLSIHYEIDLVVITSEKLDLEAKQFLEEITGSYKIFQYPKFRFAINLFKVIFNKNVPFQVAYYTFKRIGDYLKRDADKYDYVFFNLIRTTGYFHLFNPHKVVIDMVDSIGINYLRSRKNTHSILHKTIYRIEASRLISFEKLMVSKARLSLFVNKNEAGYYSKYGMVKWLPNGVNKQLLEFSSSNHNYKDCICFFGAMFYQPNIDAALWFIDHVLPELDPEIKFYIVGQRPSVKILKAAEANKNVIVTGYIDNPYEILQSALCCVAPMQTGGGIQNKILESMALGQITITNNLGANPIIGAQDKKNILIANTVEEYAELIGALYHDKNVFKSVGEEARIFIRSNFSWDAYITQLNGSLQE